MSIIGRAHPADIVVAAPQVSARHAQIEHVRDDLYMLTDLGSSNGTWVNDQRVTSAFVRSSDRIRLGSQTVELQHWLSRIPRISQVSTTRMSCPPPPDLHWALVALFSVLTLGIFALIWWIRMARWSRQQNPGSNALLLVSIGISLPSLLVVAVGFMAVLGSITVSLAALGASFLLLLAFPITMFLMTVLLITAGFEIRKSVQDYGRQLLRRPAPLSGGLTFFFPLFYLQYHMSRLAAAAQAGSVSGVSREGDWRSDKQ
jgi:hypothetical protein